MWPAENRPLLGAIVIRMVCNVIWMSLRPCNNNQPGWRNWIARKTSNLEVLGSSPRSGVSKSYFGQMCTYCHLTFFQVIWSHTHVLVSLFLSFSLLHFYLVFQLLCLVRCLSSPCNSPCHESSRELYRQSGSCIPELEWTQLILTPVVPIIGTGPAVDPHESPIFTVNSMGITFQLPASASFLTPRIRQSSWLAEEPSWQNSLPNAPSISLTLRV